MGASNRSARDFPEPRLVWYCTNWSGTSWSGGRKVPIRVRPAVLIEWRQWSKTWGKTTPKWEALIVLVDGSGERPPSVTMEWTDASNLRPIDLEAPTADPGMPDR